MDVRVRDWINKIALEHKGLFASEPNIVFLDEKRNEITGEQKVKYFRISGLLPSNWNARDVTLEIENNDELESKFDDNSLKNEVRNLIEQRIYESIKETLKNIFKYQFENSDYGIQISRLRKLITDSNWIRLSCIDEAIFKKVF